MVNKKIQLKAIEHYGKELQQVVAMEELAELQQAISKAVRGKVDTDNLAEEIADVLIVIEQIKLIYGIDEDLIQANINIKQHRTLERMNNE